jgi:hypothetical protein
MSEAHKAGLNLSANKQQAASSTAKAEAEKIANDNRTPTAAVSGAGTVTSSSPAKALAGHQPLNDAGYNYLFTVGRAGIGKTTFQRHVRELVSGQFATIPQAPRLATIEEPEISLTGVKTDVRFEFDALGSKLADGNKSNRPVLFRFRVTPKPKRRWGIGVPPELKFGFIELAGEDIEKLQSVDPAARTLMPELDAFISDHINRLCFVLVAYGAKTDESDDRLFFHFISYLRMRFPDASLQRARVLLLLADPVACKAALDRIDPQRQYEKALDVRRYVEKFLPKTNAQLEFFEAGAAIAEFYIGRIEETATEKRLTQPNYAHAQQIFSWLYKSFTGVPLHGKEKTFRRLMRRLVPKLRNGKAP